MLGYIRKLVKLFMRGKTSVVYSSTVSASVPFPMFLYWVLALETLSDSLCCRNVMWNKLFQIQVFGQCFITATKTQMRPAGKLKLKKIILIVTGSIPWVEILYKSKRQDHSALHVNSMFLKCLLTWLPALIVCCLQLNINTSSLSHFLSCILWQQPTQNN